MCIFSALSLRSPVGYIPLAYCTRVVTIATLMVTRVVTIATLMVTRVVTIATLMVTRVVTIATRVVTYRHTFVRYNRTSLQSDLYNTRLYNTRTSIIRGF